VAQIPFNPLDKRNLGESVAGALLKQNVVALAPSERFPGAGIYVIYYTGTFQTYEPISRENRGEKFQRPIYVGKAVPPGARKGGFGLGTSADPALFKRLNEHKSSILTAENLEVTDFFCRYLISDDIWIPLGESLLIEWFRPLWNVLIDGFGNHPTGERRAKQYRSRWDTLHPGRAWAARLPANPESAAHLQKIISDFLAGKAVPTISPEKAVTEEDE
jgi:hypothetical protein